MLEALFPIAKIGGELARDATQDASQFQSLVNTFGVDGPLLLAQIVNFCVVAFVLYKFAFKPVQATIDSRQKKIADGLQYAEEMKNRLAEAEKQKAETLKEASLDAKKIVDEAREQAKAYLEQKTEEANRHAEQIIHKAEEAMQLEHQSMLHQLRQEVGRLVVDTSSKVLSKELSEKERETFNNAAAKELYV